MADPLIWAMLSTAALAGLSIVALTLLRAWHAWIELQRLTLERSRGAGDAPSPSAHGRIEIADLRERLRKLEAIAAGVDL